MIITPAILGEDFADLLDKLFIIEGVSERVQIDICDGSFGIEKTWLPYNEKELPTGFSYEFDLMVNDWRKYLKRVIDLGASRVVLHIDKFTVSDFEDLESFLSGSNLYLGLCVSNDYDLDIFLKNVRIVAKFYSKLFIQVMGIRNVGAQGQPFDDRSMRRVEYIHEALRQYDIQVDGSMNNETILRMINRGASCVVIGSYIFKRGHTRESIKKTIEELEEKYNR